MQYSETLVLVAINSKYIQSNTAVYYLREILRSGGFDSGVVSHSVNEDFHGILGSIMDAKPDIVCFSCYIWNICLVYELCSAIKSIDCKIKIVLGGPEVSFEPAEALEKSGADLIVRGEGETVILGAVRGLIDKKMPDITGLYYKTGNELTDTGYAVTENLSVIPFPFTPYMMEREKDKLIYYESSRGCPFNCIYCLSSATKGVRYLSLDRVKEEIKSILMYNPGVIKFTDRSFNSEFKRAVMLLEFLSGLDTSTCFHLEIYPGSLNEEMISILKSMPAGRIQIEAGIQSTDEKVLDSSGRPQDPKSALLNLKKLMENGNIHVHIDLIAGLPGDSLKTFDKSFNDTIGVLPHKLQLGFLKLLKGTDARLIKGYKYTDMPPYEVISSDAMDYYEIQGLREISNVLEVFYNSGHFREYFRHTLTNSDSPFGIFCSISKLMKAFTAGGAGISRDNKYRILSEFSKDDPEALSLLGYDYLSSFRTKKLPSFLGGKIIDKEKAFDYFRLNKDAEARQLYKTCTMAEFSNEGEKTTYLFDYSKTNPVTGIFHVKELKI